MILRAGQFQFAFPRPALVMGIVNVTPDSFSDGGQFLDPPAAVAHALQLVEQGAEIIDVGGESTRPGALPVSEAEELRRAPETPICNAAQVRQIIGTALQSAKAMQAQAPPEMRNSPEVVDLVKSIKKEAVISFMAASLAKFKPKAGAEKIVSDLKQKYPHD